MKRYTSFAIIASLALGACEAKQVEGTPPSPSYSEAPVIDTGIPIWPSVIEDAQLTSGPDFSLSKDPFTTNIVVAVDTSGSMGGECSGSRKIDSAKTAIRTFLRSLPADAAIGVVEFGNSTGVVEPLAFDNIELVSSSVNALSSGGGTPMTNGIQISYNELVRRGVKQQGYGYYHLIVLGDGAPDNTRSTVKELDRIAMETPINVHTIGFCADLGVLDREGVQYREASNAKDLVSAFSAVLAESTVTFTGSGGFQDF